MWLSSLKIKIQIFFFFFFLKTFSELTMLKLKIIVCVNIVRFVQFCCSFWVPGTSLTLTPWVQKAQKISFSSNLPEEKNKQSNKQTKTHDYFSMKKKKKKTKPRLQGTQKKAPPIVHWFSIRKKNWDRVFLCLSIN